MRDDEFKPFGSGVGTIHSDRAVNIVVIEVADIVCVIVQVEFFVFNEEYTILSIVNIRDLASEVVDSIFPESRFITPSTIEQVINTPRISDLVKESSLRSIFVSNIVGINQSVSMASNQTQGSVCLVCAGDNSNIGNHDPILGICRLNSLPV